ncbi:galactokinase [Streptomyces sp. JJ38]|uniref:galactokinase n=1 Tax=Streptomyces sp. JJ38 TaxID=2738128 RepID=UPI001C56D072|nr:galactokinase [Streptomyces sp. JJ38]MBW1596164.1 galactokinase [Streptomyces sp. JJ38]
MSHLRQRRFRELFAAEPEGVWAAPGRVNLIGEHTDYNDGFCLPVALPHTTRVTARRRDDGRLRLHSEQREPGRITDLTVAELTPGSVTAWAAYPAGVVWALREAGHRVGGADLHIDGTVPPGAGLSSSAALECAVALAYADLHGLGLDGAALAALAQRAESAFAGVPCGIMDQLASACCTAGSALFLDCRHRSWERVPFVPRAHGLALLVVDTGVGHDLGDGSYAARRAGCERAAALLGVPALRDLAPGDLPGASVRLPGELAALVRHVVTENARVEAGVAALRSGRITELGRVLTAGHASLRDDYRVSCPQSDLAVDSALAAGAVGARMTGGGFGGSVIALAPQEAVASVSGAVSAAFDAHGLPEPRVFTAEPSAGARRVA